MPVKKIIEAIFLGLVVFAIPGIWGWVAITSNDMKSQIANLINENKILGSQISDIRERLDKTIHLTQGPEGKQGPPGPKGDRGAQGPKGDAGSKGDAGFARLSSDKLLVEDAEASSLRQTVKVNEGTLFIKQKITAGPYTIELVSCGRSASRLKCDFWITNEGGGERISLYRNRGDGTIIFLSSGYVTKAQEVNIGNVGGAKSVAYKFTMPFSIPVKGSVVFTGIDDSNVTSLQIRLRDLNNSTTHIAEFRDFVVGPQ